MPRGGHAKWPVQGFTVARAGAAHTRGLGAESKGKLEARAAVERGKEERQRVQSAIRMIRYLVAVTYR